MFNIYILSNEISVEIIDNDLFEYDEEFFIRLKNPKATNLSEELPIILDSNSEAMIVRF